MSTPNRMESATNMSTDFATTTAIPTNRVVWSHYAPGFGSFAAFIARDPDRSTTIFRRFERLNARNLLHLESELAELEAMLDTMDDEALSTDDKSERTALLAMGGSWELLTKMANEGHTAALERRNIILMLREKLKEYYEALKLSSEIMAFEQPKRRALKGARYVFRRGDRGTNMIKDKMETHLDNEQDLCVLSARSEPDRLTKLFEGRLAFLFRKRRPGADPNLVDHRDVRIAVTIISTISATLLLVGAVLALYFVTNVNVKLGILSGFTVFFALTIGLLTNAHRQEIFAATAAYAAVLVVFISGNLSSSSYSSPSPGSAASIAGVTITLTITSTIATYSSSRTTITSAPVVSATAQTHPVDSTRRVALGVGLGIGVPTLLALLMMAFVASRRRVKRRKEEFVALSHGTAETITTGQLDL